MSNTDLISKYYDAVKVRSEKHSDDPNLQKVYFDTYMKCNLGMIVTLYPKVAKYLEAHLNNINEEANCA